MSASGIDSVDERLRLSRALLTATAGMMRSTDPAMMFRAICDALPAASPRIQLAWLVLGELDTPILHPEYAVGPAAVYAEAVQVPRSPQAAEHCPVRDAIRRWEAVSGNIPASGGAAGAAGLRSLLALPLGRAGNGLNGLIVLYADWPDYFEQVGMALFQAFVHLGNASLEQAALLNNLTHLATHDLLTGVLNRRGIQESMERELARSQRRQLPFSVLLFDIDRFKLVNDRLGHREGDIVLRCVADAARAVLRNEDYLGRWGGEEFICLMPETDCETALTLAERIRRAVRETPIAVSSGELQATVSVGVASYPGDGESLDKLIATADSALYQAKRSGRDRVVCASRVEQHVHSLGNMLDAALRERRIVAAYQPIVDLATGEVVAEETLARLITPDGDIIPAGDFIEAAQQLQLLHRIDHTILMQAFSHCVTGLKTGMNRLNHFVNISADLLRHRELVEEILAAACEHCRGCGDAIGDTKPMIIEITERELLADIDQARELLLPFTEFGLRLALDDFGSGYSSYQYLADLPVQFIKIDGSLVQRVSEPKVRAILEGIQGMAEQLGVITLAEFIETAETEARLREIGIHWGQGYYYGKPTIISSQGLLGSLPALAARGI
ncbi:putative bifunctional diguanylate cyclase/phosphodiesterase [Thiohalobacter thiocyanaticus]|nr:GGDEF and EAL domain-containing protein [Thiohalobacter thiocyanaticus]